MHWKELKHKTWFRIISNKYVLIIAIFTIWMLFFDSNSWLIHRELNQELEELQRNQTYYQEEISKDSTTIDQLNNPEAIEKYAREKYFMKKENEEIYIIEYKDSIKNN